MPPRQDDIHPNCKFSALGPPYSCSSKADIGTPNILLGPNYPPLILNLQQPPNQIPQNQHRHKHLQHILHGLHKLHPNKNLTMQPRSNLILIDSRKRLLRDRLIQKITQRLPAILRIEYEQAVGGNGIADVFVVPEIAFFEGFAVVFVVAGPDA